MYGVKVMDPGSKCLSSEPFLLLKGRLLILMSME